MKKILLVALAAAAMVSCSQNEEFENATQKKEMKFNTAVMTTTRAGVITSTNFAKFKLYAYAGSTPTELISGIEFTKNGDVWGAGDSKFYWPGTETVSFYGYSAETMADDVNYAANSGVPTLTYTVKTDASAQEDLLVAKVESAATANGSISIPFTHALAKMSFKVKGEDANISYNVKSIKINAHAAGTYSYADGWAAPTDTKVDFTVSSTATSVVGGAAATSIGGTFMMMPQTDATLTVDYEYIVSGITVPVNAKTYTLTWTAASNTSYVITLDGAKEMTISGELADNWDTTPSDTDPTPNK